MPIQIDVWAGELHQDHVGSHHTDDWPAAAEFMQAQVDAGMLCNVLHTDFKAPPERVAEMEAALAAALQQQRT